MLKQPLPGRAQRRFGIACVAAIVAAVSFASWAAQPSVPADATQESIPVKPASAPTGAVSPRITEVSYRRLTRIVYPQSAIAANAQGVVYVAVHVGTDGKVASAKVDGDMPMGRTDLADAALAAVKNWTFEPRKVDGKPVPSDTIVSVAFSLDPNKPLAIEPGILDAIRVSPPLAEAATPAESVPASENVEYRLMHPPHYPASAVKAKVQGDVVLKVHVDAQGNPVEAGVAKTIPPGLSPELGNASIAAVMQWKFNPARKHGKAVDDWVSVPITFSLTEM